MSYWITTKISFSVSTDEPLRNECTNTTYNEFTAGDIVRSLKLQPEIWGKSNLYDFMMLQMMRDGYPPILPLSPYGSEGGLNVSTAFNDSNNTLDVTMGGSLRDYEPEKLPYLKFWIKTLSAMLGSGVLYMIDDGDKVVTGYEDIFDKEDSDKVIDKYIELWNSWDKKSCWVQHVLKNLEQH